jgi:hypothetical protein
VVCGCASTNAVDVQQLPVAHPHGATTLRQPGTYIFEVGLCLNFAWVGSNLDDPQLGPFHSLADAEPAGYLATATDVVLAPSS